ncbi:MAG: hypothetical protein ACRC1D_09090 [Culicoidibacterales bacterium]
MLTEIVQRMLEIQYQVMLLASSLTVVGYGCFFIVKIVRDYVKAQQMKHLLDAVWQEQESEIYYWLNKLHAQNLIFAHGENLLYYAVKAHRQQAIRYLLRAEVPIEYEVQQRFRVSVLSMAIIEKEPIEYIQMLVEAGADVLYRDSFDKTPMQYAREAQRLEVMNLLVEKQNKKADK